MSRTYYWILTLDSESGRPIVLGPYGTEAEANEIGFSKIGTSFEVIPLQTRNVAAATKVLKHRRFVETERLQEALKRARHTA
jgi:hypothetical protein